MAENKYTLLSTEYDQLTGLLYEEFPEGPYGHPKNLDISRDEWRAHNHWAGRQSYETRKLHEGLPRLDPGAHATDDEQGSSHQDPYSDTSY